MNNVWDKNIILQTADKLVHQIYRVTGSFPREEIYGVTSQLRRAALSVVLNMIEGYARFKLRSHINFLEISFGSLKEVQYLIEFCYKEKYLSLKDRNHLNLLCE